MTFRKSFIVSALFLFSSLEAQQIIVINASDKIPIENVAVFNTKRENSAFTDTIGTVDLSIFSRSDTLTFQHPSYITSHIPVLKLEMMRFVELERKNVLIDEFVISASKYRESKLIIPYVVDVMDESILRESTGQTAAEILEGTGNILVQKTQGGGGVRSFADSKPIRFSWWLME